MSTYVAFLRAINLGAKRKFGKDELRGCLARNGFFDVETYLNTGNVLLRGTQHQDGEKLAGTLEALFETDRGFEVPTVVMSLSELRAIHADGKRLTAGWADLGQHYVSLLKQRPRPEAVAEVEALGIPGERVVVRGRGCHLLLSQRENYHNSKLGNALIERRLGVATNRNFRVISALVDKWAH